VKWSRLAFGALASAALVVVACGEDDPAPSVTSDAGPPNDSGRLAENTGQSCAKPADCYLGLDGASVNGEVQCLDRVTGGYCTHLCEKDSDCCAVPGECKSGFKQVCAPFESTGKKMCFLSCEEADLHLAPDGGVLDDTAYCAFYGAAAFRCRSTGGGNKNRKVCVP
jgi:hypothetical protein